MCERKQLTQEQIDLLNQPLPPEALKQHPTKKFLSSINAIYVTERFNAVFGVGQWQTRVEVVDTKPTKPDRNNNISVMVVTKTTFEVPEYGIYYECFGGNDNDDLGDAYKGSTTDAITKIGSFLGIGAHVWKNQGTPNGKPLPQQPAKPQKPLRERIIDYLTKMDEKKRNEYLTYFQISSVNAIDDKKAQEIADFEKQKAKEKKQ
jgi:hypothetical protein